MCLGSATDAGVRTRSFAITSTPETHLGTFVLRSFILVCRRDGVFIGRERCISQHIHESTDEYL